MEDPGSSRSSTAHATRSDDLFWEGMIYLVAIGWVALLTIPLWWPK